MLTNFICRSVKSYFFLLNMLEISALPVFKGLNNLINTLVNIRK